MFKIILKHTDLAAFAEGATAREAFINFFIAKCGFTPTESQADYYMAGYAIVPA